MNENLLQNPSFEDGYREVDGIPELKVANGWEPWWAVLSARPEFKVAVRNLDPRRIRSGHQAQCWFNNYNRHTAGIFQRVYGIQTGATLLLEAWVQAWASSNDEAATSDGKYRMRIGLDPYGGIDPESPDIVWSNDGHAIQPYNMYFRLEVETIARSDRVTVFVWGQNEWSMKHNDAYVDDVVLESIGDKPPTPPLGDFVTREEFASFREVVGAGLTAQAECLIALAECIEG